MPTRPVISTSIPVSSAVSRTAVSGSDSPWSMPPPGRAQLSLSERRISRMAPAYPHRHTQVWETTAVRAILQNPRYTGRQVWNRARTNEVLIDVDDVALGHENRHRWNDPSQWAWSRSESHTPLISTEHYERAQRTVKTRGAIGEGGKAPRRSRHPYLFRGLLRCGLCDRVMGGQRQPRTHLLPVQGIPRLRQPARHRPSARPLPPARSDHGSSRPLPQRRAGKRQPHRDAEADCRCQPPRCARSASRGRRGAEAARDDQRLRRQNRPLPEHRRCRRRPDTLGRLDQRDHRDQEGGANPTRLHRGTTRTDERRADRRDRRSAGRAPRPAEASGPA
ncbi:hypothetical protein BKA14_003728 [Actinoplanes abujensis]|uniref:Recombinase domain-containing protein n=1 Tax=Paractinoplanes abujensis TaxID=882441 RepID=A0A7W7G2Y0_9ACTN|nr:hypothetical protein [Actinoplanes abujensis]